MKKLTTIIAIAMFASCAQPQKTNYKTSKTETLKSRVRDSLDKISNKKYHCDFCDLINRDDLNDYEADLLTEKKIPIYNLNAEGYKRRDKLHSYYYRSLTKASKKKLNYPDSVFNWAIMNNGFLDTVCRMIPHYRSKFEQGKTLISSRLGLVNEPIVGGSLSTDENSSVYKMHVVFKGEPDEESIKKLIEAVMIKYHMPINEDNALHVGNMLMTLSNESAVGVTEMDILKDMYQNGSSAVSLSAQGGLSAGLLELRK